MKYKVHPMYSVSDTLDISHIAYVKLYFVAVFWKFLLVKMAHIILL